MSERLDRLTRIKDELEDYVARFCPCDSSGKFDDFSGEKCNDALLLLQDAVRELKPGA